VASFGLLTGGYPESSHFDLSPLGYGLWSGYCLYLTHHRLSAPLLAKLSIVGPPTGSWPERALRAAAGRLPHILFLVLTYWGPCVSGHSRSPGSGCGHGAHSSAHWRLPITPVGLGTTQAALVLLFSPYVPFTNPEVRGRGSVGLQSDLLFLGDGGPSSVRPLVLAETTSYPIDHDLGTAWQLTSGEK